MKQNFASWVSTTRIVVTLLALILSGAPTLEAQLRRGFWFSPGAAIGYVGCRGCGENASGYGGSIGLGITATTNWRVGLGVSWVKVNRAEGWERYTTLDLRGRLYPLRTGLFAAGGFGVGVRTERGGNCLQCNQSGASVHGGLGWDISLSRSLALTPFANLHVLSLDPRNYVVSQIGLSLTFR